MAWKVMPCRTRAMVREAVERRGKARQTEARAEATRAAARMRETGRTRRR